ncbi:MAG: hypothetical protein IKZ72_05960 [Bacteroidales bacterium]|nr:hypothetical protein [Bacteroidales bacterium]
MLLACFVLEADGSEASVTVRVLKRGTLENVFSGLPSQWGSVRSDIRKYGRCMICFYEGEAVLSIDRAENKDITADLASNAKMMTEVYPDDRAKLLFVDRKDLSGIRRMLTDAGIEIIAEHLVPNGCLKSDDALADYYDRVCKRELSLKTGTIEERKMLAYRISRLRAMALPILTVVFALSLGASLIDMHTSAETERLSSVLRTYSSTLDRTRHSAGDVEKVLSSREEPVPDRIASILNAVSSVGLDGIKFKSVSVSGRTVVIDAMTPRPGLISGFSRSLAGCGDALFDSVEVSEVKRSSLEGYMDFRITAHIK